MNSTCELGRHSARALKPYPAYKDSRIAWLGEVPEHWQVRRLKYLLKEGDMRSGDGKEQLLRVSQYTGVTPRRPTGDGDQPDTRAESLVGYKCVEPSDLIVNIMLAWNGSLGVSRFRGITSPAYCVYRFRMDVNPWYFHRLLRSVFYKAYIKTVSTGIVESRLRLYTDNLYQMKALLPPPAEQAAIVRFIDHADRRIRRYIRAKEKLIALLKEQKQAIIHQAVTGQIDVRTGKPYPAYKDSRVEWLGEVPKHWKILPLKRWVSTKITDGPHETPALLDDGIPFMSAESMVGGRLDFSRRRGFISREQHEVYCRKCRPRRDDIFMCKSGATTGKVAIVEIADEFSVWSPLALVRVEPHKVLARLLFAVLQTRYVQRQVQDTWSYGTQPNLAMRAMERLVVVLPPIDEQQEVLAHLDRAAKKPSEAIDRAHREIFLLREYRIRLIADVVTGKLDVREASASLPEVDPAADEEDLDDALDIGAEAEGSELALSAEEVEA